MLSNKTIEIIQKSLLLCEIYENTEEYRKMYVKARTEFEDFIQELEEDRERLEMLEEDE